MMTPATPPIEIPEHDTLQDGFEALEDQLNAHLVERTNEIRAAITAVLARRHVFLIGPPGTGKSYLVDMLTESIVGATKFSKLLTRFTVPEEVFGPMSVKGLEHDRFVRKIDRRLPSSTLAFLDEIFKASSAILNALLRILNERTYEHDAELINVPLSTVFAASNELPQSEELGALYDRLDVRLEVAPIRDTANFLTMLRGSSSPLVPLLSWDQVIQAQSEVAQVKLTDEVLEQIADLRRKLAAEGIEPTDRRFRSSLSLVQASAWLDGCSATDTEHLLPLQYVLWDRPEQRQTVESMVLAVASPLEQECRELLAELDRLETRLQDALSGPSIDRQNKGTEIHVKLNKASKELKAIQARVGDSRQRANSVKVVKERLFHLTDTVLRDIFQLNPEEYLRQQAEQKNELEK